MTFTKTSTTLISNATLSASGSNTSTSSIDLSDAIDFGVGYQMTFNASAGTNGATIYLYADASGNNSSFTVGTYDDPADAGDVAGDAGHTVKGFIQFNRAAKYVKVKVVNNSSSYSITGVYIYGIVQAQS